MLKAKDPLCICPCLYFLICHQKMGLQLPLSPVTVHDFNWPKQLKFLNSRRDLNKYIYVLY